MVTQDMEAGEEVKSPSNLDFNLMGTKWDNHVSQVSLDYGYQPENSPGWYSKLWIQYQVVCAEKVLGRQSKLHSEVTVNLFRRSLCSKTGMLSFWILEWTTSFSLKTYFRNSSKQNQNDIPGLERPFKNICQQFCKKKDRYCSCSIILKNIAHVVSFATSTLCICSLCIMK